MPDRTYLGTRGDAGWTRCSRSDCQREHAEHLDGEGAMLCPVTPETLTDGMIRELRPAAYEGPFGTLTLEEQPDCYRADGSLQTDPALRAAACQRICDAINALRPAGVNVSTSRSR
jgi:hypothetical protein